ncbi:unnamed protein product [Lampetra fluviatilis]
MDEARCFDESARLIRDEHRGGARVCFTFSEQRVSAMCTAARDKFFFGRTATLLFIANFRFPKGFQPLHH